MSERERERRRRGGGTLSLSRQLQNFHLHPSKGRVRVGLEPREVVQETARVRVNGPRNHQLGHHGICAQSHAWRGGSFWCPKMPSICDVHVWNTGCPPLVKHQRYCKINLGDARGGRERGEVTSQTNSCQQKQTNSHRARGPRGLEFRCGPAPVRLPAARKQKA